MLGRDTHESVRSNFGPQLGRCTACTANISNPQNRVGAPFSNYMARDSGGCMMVLS